MSGDPRVMQHFPSTLDRAGSDALAGRIEALIAERGWGFWALEERATMRFIGFAGLHVPAHEFSFSPCVEVGWRLCFDAWGQGFATEAAQTALAFAFQRLHLPKVVSFTAVPNDRSRAVMVRLGMHQVGTFDHPALEAGHRLRRHWLYEMPRDQFRS